MRDSDARGADAPPSARDALGRLPRSAGIPQDGDGARESGVGELPSRPPPPPAAKPVPARQGAPPPPEPPPARGTALDLPQRPMPVRDGAPPPAKPAQTRDTVRPEPAKRPSSRDAAPPPARDLVRGGARPEPVRDVKLGEETWTIRLKGAATVGSGHAGARILSVAFEGPEKRTDPAETRYVLARRLEDIGEDELVSLVREVAHNPDATSRPPPRRERPQSRGRGRGGRRSGT